MRISELSRHSGVPISTIKFYIREGLLAPGERSQRNQAAYSEQHLGRLDLIRSLTEVARLPLDVIRRVIEQLDRPWGEGQPVQAALRAIYAVPERDLNAAEKRDMDELREQIRALLNKLPWAVEDEGHMEVDWLADAVFQMRRHHDAEFPVESLERFGAAAWLLSEIAFDLGDTDIVPRPGDDLVEPTRVAVLAMLLLEPIYTSLVRMALASRSMRISLGLPLPPAWPDGSGGAEA